MHRHAEVLGFSNLSGCDSESDRWLPFPQLLSGKTFGSSIMPLLSPCVHSAWRYRNDRSSLQIPPKSRIWYCPHVKRLSDEWSPTRIVVLHLLSIYRNLPDNHTTCTGLKFKMLT